MKELYRQNQRFHRMNYEFHRKKIELYRENQKFHRKQEVLQMEKEELHTHKEDIQRENQKFRMKNKGLHKENQNFSRKNNELLRENQRRFLREKKELHKQKEGLQRENKELEHRYQEVIEQLQSSSQQRIHKLEQEVLEKVRDMDERQQQVHQKEHEVGYLLQELQQEQENSAQLQERLDQSTADLEHLQQELQQERERSAQLQEQLDQSIAGLEHLQHELQQEQERSAQLQKQLDQSTAEQEQIRPTKALLNSIQFNTASRSEVQVQENIGRGGWGMVARGQFNGQVVAIKWPHEALEHYPNIIGRMRREVQIMSQVRHPNLVRFIAAVLDEAAEQLQASPMIITELLDTNLRIAYQGGRFQEAHCTSIFCDVAFALHYLHSHLPLIIHRDVSTPNVLLQALPNRGWLAKVSDFGSANLAELAHTIGEGAIVFTAPEALPHTDLDTDPPKETTKMDVFSYGVLMCEVLIREPPFTHNYLRNTLQRLQHRPEHGLILRCIKRSPKDRPSMAEVLDELYKLPHPLPIPN